MSLEVTLAGDSSVRSLSILALLLAAGCAALGARKRYQRWVVIRTGRRRPVVAVLGEFRGPGSGQGGRSTANARDRSGVGWLGPIALIALAAGAAVGLGVGSGLHPLYPLLGVMVLAFLLLGFVEPQVAAVAAVVLGMGRVSDVAVASWGAPSIYKALAAFLGALVVLRLLKSRGRTLVVSRTLLLMFGLLAVMAVSGFLAGDADEAFARIDDTSDDLIIAALVANLLTDRRGLRWVVWGVVGLGAGLAMLTVYQGLTGNYDQQFFGLAKATTQHIVGETNRPRAAGPWGDPNYYGQYLLVFAALALFRTWDERSLFLRLAGLAALGLILVALLFTFSRGAMVALVLASTVVLALRRPSAKALVAGAVVCLPLLMLMPANLTDRLATMRDLLPGGQGQPELEISFRGRLSEALAGVGMFLDHPVLGVGPGNAPLRYQEYATDLGLEYRRAERTSHNLFIEMAAETGVLGLVLFSLAVASALADLRLAARRFRVQGDSLAAGLTDSVLTGLVAFLAAGLFLSLSYPRGLWLLMALAIAARRLADTSYTSHAHERRSRQQPSTSSEPSLAVGVSVA